MDSKGRGRPPAKILTDHFTQIEKVGNQSNGWYYKCNYCGPDERDARIENRDNKALKHLLVNQHCPDCPQSIHNIVRTHLASKSIDVFLAEPITASAEARTESTSEAGTSGGGVVKAVKRPRTLMGFADTVTALTTTQQDRANFKLFRLAFISKHWTSNDHTMSVTDPDLESDRKEVLEGTVYSWLELELVEKGTKSASFEEDISVINKSAAPGSTTWNIKDISSSLGIY